MLKNYLAIAVRNLLRHKLLTSINVSGLSIGISACVVIFLLVHYERNFDNFHPDKERIYRVYSKYSGLFDATNSGIAFPVPAAIRTECTGVEAVGHFMTLNDLEISVDSLNRQRKTLEEQNHVVAAEPDYFKVFSGYQWLVGTPVSSLTDPFKVVLTESRVKTYFGNLLPADAIGREIAYNDSLRATVSGVVRDLEGETDLHFTDFISFSTIPQSWLKNDLGGMEGMKDWGSTTSASQVFIKLEKSTPIDRITQQFDHLIVTQQPDKDAKLKLEYLLQPLSELRFSTIGIFDSSRSPANRATLHTLQLVAALLLLIAGINFVNLATAQAMQRAKEVGVRKVLGSPRSTLVLQFLGETLVLAAIAAIFSMVLAKMALHFFHEFLPDGLEINLFSSALWTFMGAVVLTVTLLAGLYPAFVLSGFRPVIALKASLFSKGNSGTEWMRRGLIVFQFSISLVLIIGALIVDRQIHFMQDKDMGFQKDAIVHFRLPYQQPPEKKVVLKNKLEQLSGISALSLHSAVPASNSVNTRIYKFNDGKEVKDFEFHVKAADSAYIHLYGISLLAGQNLRPSDTLCEYLINETALHLLGFRDPQEAIHKTLEVDKGKVFPIVGVVKDFHSRSLHEPIHPLVIVAERNKNEISLKLATSGKGLAHFQATLAQVTNAWREVYPNDKLEYEFVDESIAKFYENERRTSKMVRTATGIAIFISCIGLFGLVSFTVVRRTKEIGIRKVLGASVAGITGLLTKDFLKLVLAAIVISSPVAYYFMQRWLKDFAYRIDIQWWMFAVAALAAVAVAFLTVGFQSVRAALANPVKSLRSE